MLVIKFTYILIGVTVLTSLKGFSDSDFLYKWMNNPVRIRENKEYYRLISHQFIHGDAAHLFFNMFALYGFGNLVESYYIYFKGVELGEFNFIALYIMGGIFASFISLIRHKNNPNYNSLGASGAVSAVLFAAILLQPTSHVFFFFIEMPAYVFGPLYIALEFYLDRKKNTGVAHDAHISGALFGLTFICLTNFEAVRATFINIFG